MAKELPFFKFEPGQWDNGRIQMCSFEAQGIFINICAMYWHRLGDLPYKLVLQKICKGNATALQSLCDEGVVKVIDGVICIDFLNEQLAEFENTSKANSEAARIRWEKHRENADALRAQSERNAIRGEERIEEKMKEEKKVNGATYVATIDQRSKIFYDKLKPFLEEFGKETIRKFYDYWSEHSEGGRKMRFEKEKVFDIRKRLTTWKNREHNGVRNGIEKTNGATTAIIPTVKDFGIKQGFSRNNIDGGRNGGGS